MIKLALYCIFYFFGPALVKALEAKEERGANNRPVERRNKWQKLYLASRAREQAISDLQNKHNHSHTGIAQPLPSEIIASILDVYIQQNPLHIGVLRLVCRTWNAIILRSPPLWTRIHLIGPFRTKQFESWKEQVDTCVIRSGVLPLHVVFEVKDYAPEAQHNDKTTWALLEYIGTRASARLASFTYRQTTCRWLPDDQIYQSALQIILANANCLLELSLRDSSQANFLSTYKPLFTSNLIHTSLSSLVSLELIDMRWEHVANMVALQSIQNLTVGWTKLLQWYELLQSNKPWLLSFPSLKTLTFKIDDTPDEFLFVPDVLSRSIGFDQLVGSNIVTLVLCGPIPRWFYRKLEFPLLRDLVIQANSKADHIFHQNTESWDCRSDVLGLLPEGTVTLACAQCSAFWSMEVEDEPQSMGKNEQKIRRTFEILLTDGKVKKFRARSCVWGQLVLVLGVRDEEIQELSYGLCGDFREISVDRLQNILGPV
ncbi:hypothetical protein CPB86DRAFT_790486 [Serendipita vermifera]|nr:hypothetical protein CPB86DRAFT_790486 [Serendipita vermifera]